LFCIWATRAGVLLELELLDAIKTSVCYINGLLDDELAGSERTIFSDSTNSGSELLLCCFESGDSTESVLNGEVILPWFEVDVTACFFVLIGA